MNTDSTEDLKAIRERLEAISMIREHLKTISGYIRTIRNVAVWFVWLWVISEIAALIQYANTH